MLDRYKVETQRALDDLFCSKQIPFKLVAREITEEYPGEFTIHFYDSRLRSVIVRGLEATSFAPQVRAAVLKRLGGKRESATLAA